MTEEERKQCERAFFTGHYPYMMQALTIAMQHCMVWRIKESGEAVTFEDLFTLAKQQDEEHPLKEGAFYMVTSEGAIGLSPGLEYLTEWIFIPMEPCEERDQLLQETIEELKRQEAEEAGDKKTVDKETVDKEQPANDPQPTDNQQANREKRFCTHCGAPLIEGNLFCVKCGTKI